MASQEKIDERRGVAMETIAALRERLGRALGGIAMPEVISMQRVNKLQKGLGHVMHLEALADTLKIVVDYFEGPFKRLQQDFDDQVSEEVNRILGDMNARAEEYITAQVAARLREAGVKLETVKIQTAPVVLTLSADNIASPETETPAAAEAKAPDQPSPTIAERGNVTADDVKALSSVERGRGSSRARNTTAKK